MALSRPIRARVLLTSVDSETTPLFCERLAGTS